MMGGAGNAPTAGARTALVTGATGALGPALVDRLLRDGHRVRVLSRGRLPAPWPAGTIDLCRGDIVDRELVIRAMKGVDWVFHLAAQLHISDPDAALATQFERVNVEGTRAVTDAALVSNVSRLVFFSTIAVYGSTGTKPVDEDDPPRPDSLYGKTKLRAEEVVRSAGGRGALSTSILRLGAVYGTRLKGNYARLARALASGWFVPVGPGLNRRTLVYETDAAIAAVLAASSPRAGGRLYNVSDGQLHPLREILGAMCRALDRPEPARVIPLGLARVGARAGDVALAALGRRRRLGPALEKYTEDVAVRSERIRSELGFRSRVGLDEGWRDALHGHTGRDHG